MRNRSSRLRKRFDLCRGDWQVALFRDSSVKSQPRAVNCKSMTHEEHLKEIVLQSPLLEPVLVALEHQNLEQGYLCAGGVAQTVWNHLLGKPLEYGIKDLDVIYFDSSDLSEESEVQTSHALERLLKNGSVPLDVKNEARVHLWYKRRFGYSIAPYLSSKDALASFPTTATAVGVRLARGRLEVCAPFGLDDLFALIVRPNPRQITLEIYQNYCERWSSRWPELTYLPWGDLKS